MEFQKQADIKTSDRKIWYALASIPNGWVSVLDRDLRVFFAAGKDLESVGFPAEKLVGNTLAEALPGELAAYIEPYILKALEGQDVEFDIVLGERLYRVTAAPTRDEHGEIQGVIIIAQRDLESSPGGVAATRAHQEILAIWESITDGVLVLDSDWCITYANSQAERILQRPREELLDKNLWEEYPEAVDSDFYRYYHQAVAEQTAVHFEAFFAPLNLWADVRAYPSPVGLAVYIQDIGKRKQAEASQQLLATIVESSSDAISGMNLEGMIVTWNRGAELLYGYTAQEAIGQPISILRPPNRPQEIPNLLEKLRKGERIWNLETQRKHKDGHLVDVSLSISPMLDAAGQITGFSAITRNFTEQKRAEEALRYSERLYHTLVKNFPNGAVYLLDRECRVLLAEGRGLTAAGFNPEAIRGKVPREILDDDELCRRLELAHAQALEGEESSFEVELRGRFRAVRVVPIRDENGIVSVVLAMTQDITERRLAEEGLRRSEASLARAQEVAHLGYMEADAATGEDFWSDESYRILGLEPQSLTPSFDRLLEYIPPEDKGFVIESARDLFQNGQPFEIEHRIVRPDGEVRWVQAQAEVLADAKGASQRFVCTLLDITERKQAEAAQARLATIVESSNDAIISKTLDGTITTWNRGAELIYGYTEQEAIGRNINLLLLPDWSQEFADTLETLKQGKLVAPFETKRVRKDGQIIDISIASSPIQNANGEVIGASSIVRDITAQKQAEAERERFFTLSLDLLCIVDEQGRFRRANPAFERVLGYSPKELEGQSILDYLHPDDVAASREALERLTSGLSLINFSNRYRCRDGSYKDILWATAPHGQLRYGAGRDITDIKIAEQELQQSLALLQATLESTADGILVVNSDGRITRFNQQCIAMWGNSSEIHRDGEYLQFIKAVKEQLTNSDEFEALAHHMLADHRVQGFDILTLRNGRVYERYTKTQWLGEHNLGWVWSFRDITERVDAVQEQAELNRKLEHHRRQLDDILTSVPGIVWENSVDPITHQQRVVYISKFVETMLGYTQEEWDQDLNLWMKALHPEDRQAALEQSEAILRGQHTGILRYRLITRDNRTVWTETHCAVVHDEQGAVVGLRGVTMDITERMEAQAEQSRLAALLESTTDLVAWTDVTGRVQYINPAGRTILGLSADESADQLMFTDFMASWVNDILLREGIPAASKNGSWAGETAVLHRDGREIPMSQVITAHKDGEGKDIFFSTIARDISESKRVQSILEHAKEELEARVEERTAELADINRELEVEIVEKQKVVGQLEAANQAAELARTHAEAARLEAEHAKEESEQANRAKSEFLSRMSHELRTPLNAILGFGQILEMDDGLPLLQRESVEHILKAGHHLLELINEVLDISRIEAGTLSLSIEAVSVDQAFREVLSLMQPLAQPNGIQLINEVSTGSPRYVMADRQRLNQILLNLISNAIKYNRPGGRVTVSQEEMPDGMLRLKVQDTGMGLSAEELARLFTPFDRLGASKTNIEGTGIGLVLSQRLVLAMAGTIEVESIVGQGSTFSVQLPSGKNPAEWDESLNVEMVDSASEESAAQRYTVLYIEDNLPNLRLIEMLLEDRQDVRLIPAMQGSTGMDFAMEHNPDLILLDLHLPDIDGDEVLRRLQTNPDTAQIPVIIISADATPGQVERLLNSGARMYLTKPLNVKEFLGVLDEYLK